MIEAVFFDLDGTVANTNELIYQSFKRMFTDKMKMEVEDAEIYSLFGEPLTTSLLKYQEDITDIMDYYRTYNAEHHDAMVTSFVGVEEALKAVKENGLKLGIVTSKREAMARRSLSCLGLLDYFDVIVTPEYTEKHKPILYGKPANLPGASIRKTPSWWEMPPMTSFVETLQEQPRWRFPTVSSRQKC